MGTEISVVMSVYNSEIFLAEAIESTLNQTFKDFEFIIINDASTDESSFIIGRYMQKDNRIILINNETNLGLTKSLNKGLKFAKGSYVARMDADDISMPDRLEKQYNFLEDNSVFTLVTSGAYLIDSKNNLIKKVTPLSEENLYKRLLRKNAIFHSSIMFRNENYVYREKFIYSQDYDLYLMLLSDGKRIGILNDYLIQYRIQKDSISFSKMGRQKLFAEKAKEFYFQRLNHNDDNYANFDPDMILKIETEESENKIVIETEIKSDFGIENYLEVRKKCKKYFKLYGYSFKILLFYLSTFLNRTIIYFIISIIPVKILRKWNE